MDSKIVNKAIKKTIWSFLREQGFSVFTSRNAWRFYQGRIEVVNFQSFNSFLAESLGCTTYSFVVNLGIYYTNIPYRYPNLPIKEKEGHLLPEEYACHFRKVITKHLIQEEIDRKDVWYINKEGNNIETVMEHVKQSLLEDGFKWFEKYSHMNVVLDTLLNDEEDMIEIFGFGRKGSPIRNYQGGYIAFFLNKYDLARDMFEKAIKSGCFNAISDRLNKDYEIAKNKLSNI